MRNLLFVSWTIVVLAGNALGSGCGGNVEYDGRGPDDTSTGTGTSTSTSTGTSTGVSTATFTGTSTVTSTGTSTVTGTPTSTDTGVGDCGDLIFSDPSCDQCVNAQCCSEKAGCAFGTACDPVLDCIVFSCVPEDQQCIEVCKSMNPSGSAAYEALFGCLERACPFCLDEPQPG